MNNSLLRAYYRLLRRVIHLVAKPDFSGIENLDMPFEESSSTRPYLDGNKPPEPHGANTVWGNIAAQPATAVGLAAVVGTTSDIALSTVIKQIYGKVKPSLVET